MNSFFFWVNLFDRFFCHFYKFKLHKFIQKLKSILAWFNTSKFSFVAVGVNSDVFTFSFQSQFWRSIFHSRVNSDVCFFCVFSVFFIRFNFPKVDHNVYVYKKLRVCQRGISEGNSEVGKKATTFDWAKCSNFFYMMLQVVVFLVVFFQNFKFRHVISMLFSDINSHVLNCNFRVNF